MTTLFEDNEKVPDVLKTGVKIWLARKAVKFLWVAASFQSRTPFLESVDVLSQLNPNKHYT